ncbi:MAG: PEP-CTERM sorting domain-containing protein [Methylococcales bacterium]|nr:PEP-CTERM sorting domain-containing protein [Methylococcales bacterium]
MKKTILTLGVATLALSITSSQATLALYDAQVAGSGFTARTTAISPDLTGTNSVIFDFGAITGDATFDFIVRGDHVAGGRDGFLAVGNSNSTSNLRYEGWDNTGELGFSRSGVADYNFTPGVASPSSDTLVTYRWTDATDTMDLFMDGVFAATQTAGPTFEMATGPGHLGNNAALGEGMVGTISRVTTYNSAQSNADILARGNAWTAVPEPSGMALIGLAGLAMIARRRR